MFQKPTHTAFELFLGDCDRGEITRTQATDGVAALATIVADATAFSTRAGPDDIAAPVTRARDEVLTAIADDRGLDDLDDTGMPLPACIVRLEIGPSEIGWCASQYRHQMVIAGLGDPIVLVGHFLVARTASGERMVREYESGVALADAWANSDAVVGGLGWT